MNQYTIAQENWLKEKSAKKRYLSKTGRIRVKRLSLAFFNKFHQKRTPAAIHLKISKLKGNIKHTKQIAKQIVRRKANMMRVPEHQNRIKIGQRIEVIVCPHCGSLLKGE